MSEMIERVARAIAAADEQNGGPPYEYRITLSKHSKEQLFDEARAAIEAMREPTFKQQYAALPMVKRMHQTRDIYITMVEAALND